jgi:hypothetical protein
MAMLGGPSACVPLYTADAYLTKGKLQSCGANMAIALDPWAT